MSNFILSDAPSRDLVSKLTQGINKIIGIAVNDSRSEYWYYTLDQYDVLDEFSADIQQLVTEVECATLLKASKYIPDSYSDEDNPSQWLKEAAERVRLGLRIEEDDI